MRRFVILLGFIFSHFPVYAAPDGAKLYSQNCAGCHGDKGDGGIGIPLALPSFQSSVDDDYLKLTMLHGRAGRVMPSFSYFSNEEADAIVKYMRSWFQGKIPVFSGTRISGNAKRGEQLFGKHCAACHGASGEGGHGTGVTFSRPRDFPIIAPALHNPGYLSSAKDAMIKATLVKGREGTPMVASGKLGLKNKDINDIVAYVRSFEKNPLSSSSKLIETGEAILQVESPYDLKTTIDNVKRAVGSSNFVFIREQALNAGLVAEGTEDTRQHIIYFCNFNLLNQALASDPRVGLFLPCRITVVEQGGKVTMMAVNPKRLSRIFNNSELNEMCDQVTKMYVTVMEEAAL
jgi:cytochrome c oxidase cbb3-type subunit 3